MVNDHRVRLKAQGLGLEVADALPLNEGDDEAYGARPLRRVVQQDLEYQIAGRLLHKEARPGQLIVVCPKANALALELKGQERCDGC